MSAYGFSSADAARRAAAMTTEVEARLGVQATRRSSRWVPREIVKAIGDHAKGDTQPVAVWRGQAADSLSDTGEEVDAHNRFRDLADGEAAWALLFPHGWELVPLGAAEQDGIVYYPTASGGTTVLGILTSDGSQSWSASVTSTPENFTVNPADRVLCSNGGALNDDGTAYTGSRLYTYIGNVSAPYVSGVGHNRIVMNGDTAWTLGLQNANTFSSGTLRKVDIVGNTVLITPSWTSSPYAMYCVNAIAVAPNGDIYIAGAVSSGVAGSFPAGGPSGKSRAIWRFDSSGNLYSGALGHYYDDRPQQTGVYTTLIATSTRLFAGYMSQYDVSTDFNNPLVLNGWADRLDVLSLDLQTRYTPLSTQFVGSIAGWYQGGVWQLAASEQSPSTCVAINARPGSSSSSLPWLVRLNDDGSAAWTKLRDSPFQTSQGLDVDPSGNAYVNYGTELRKYDPSGNLLWTVTHATKTPYGLRHAKRT